MLTPGYVIAAARCEDLPLLPAIELAAARLLADQLGEADLNETTSADVLAQAQRDGRLWVVLDHDVPVGFALVIVLESDSAHLEEIDVLPVHGRRGLGTRLLLHVCGWAANAGFAAVTLTTFRDVPWNMPFYARHGFTVIPDDELGPALRTIVEEEARRGLDPSIRVAMRRAAAPAEQCCM